MARQLSQADLALVIKRATELHNAGDDAAGEVFLDEHEALDLLREAGLSDDAARQALTEWQRGNLSYGVALPAPAPQTRLAPTACVARQLPIAPDRMADVFDAAVRRQLYVRGRRDGLGGDWLPRQGALAKVSRRLDFSGKLLLKDVDRLHLDVRPGGGGHSRVTVTADVSSYRSALLTGLVGVPAVAAVGFGLGAIEVTELVIGTPIGLLAAGGGYQRAGRLLDKRREQVAEALDVLLDRMA
jgi:hypothetical protein